MEKQKSLPKGVQQYQDLVREVWFKSPSIGYESSDIYACSEDQLKTPIEKDVKAERPPIPKGIALYTSDSPDFEPAVLVYQNRNTGEPDLVEEIFIRLPGVKSVSRIVPRSEYVIDPVYLLAVSEDLYPLQGLNPPAKESCKKFLEDMVYASWLINESSSEIRGDTEALSAVQDSMASKYSERFSRLMIEQQRRGN